MPIIPFEGHTPKIHPRAFIAPTAVIIGDVTVAAGASIWYGCVLRGDIEPIIVGEDSNIQDNSVLHTAGGEPCIVGRGVTVGHMACLHACIIHDRCLIGMMATILNRSEIGADTIVGAKALIPEGKIFSPSSLLMGVPAKVIRTTTPQDRQWIEENRLRYIQNGPRHDNALKEFYQSSTTPTL
jgi:carbonic anhydrase/acetyltransferase-like protein (isoleucine patch superfamily)